MLNLSPGLFEEAGLQAVPFIKDVVVNDSRMESTEIKSLDIEITVLVATPDNGPLSQLNLHISAIKDQQRALSIHTGNASNNLRSLILSEYETPQRQYTNVFLQDYTSTAAASVVNPNADTVVYYRTVKVPMTVTYVGDIDYLCLVAVVSEAYNPNSTEMKSFKEYFQTREFAVSSPSVETVLQGGRAPIGSNIFLLADDVADYGTVGDVWPLAVHRHPTNNLMAGSTHSAKLHPKVSAVRVPNLKTKDYRMSIINDLSQDPTNEQSVMPQESDYRSPLYFSRSNDNALKMFFSFDFKNFIINNSALAHIFKNDNSLMSTAQIGEIKIYRQRVDGEDHGNRLTPSKHVDNTPCFDRSTKDLVARLSDNSVFIVKATSVNSVYEIAAVDRSMSDQGPGSFLYSIEIQVIDNSISVVKDMITRLRLVMTDFESYLLKCFNFEKKNYNVETYMNAMTRLDSGAPVWKAVISEYVSSLLFLNGPVFANNISVMEVTRNLIALSAPPSATHASLKQFKQQVNDFILQLENLVGERKTLVSCPYTDPTRPAYPSEVRGSNAAARRLKYNFVERRLYRNDVESSTGFDYLGDSVQTNQITFDRVSIPQYGTRISKEIDKYQVGSTNLAGANKYGFISVDKIRMPDGDIEVGKENSFSESLQLLRAKKTMVSRNISFTAAPSLPEGQQVDVEDLLSEAGVSYERNDGCIKRLAGLIVRQNSNELPVIDSSFYFSSISGFVRDDDSEERSSAEDASISNNRKAKPISAESVQSVIRGVATSFKKSTASNINTLSGSYAAAAIASSQADFSSLNLFDKNIKFNSVVRVEYLAGYDKGVRDPDWVTLTGAAIEMMVADKRSFLCRLTIPTQGLNIENAYELPMYTALFALGPSTITIRDPMIESSEVVDQLKESISTLLSSGPLNINAAGGSLESQFTCSDMMIYGAPSSGTTTSTPTPAAGGSSGTSFGGGSY